MTPARVFSEQIEKKSSESLFLAIPEMGPLRFRERKISDYYAFGGPRSSCVRHAFVLRFATHSRTATTNDSTPFRLPHVLSPPAMEQQTPTKHPALRLRGGRRTSLRFLCSFHEGRPLALPLHVIRECAKLQTRLFHLMIAQLMIFFTVFEAAESGAFLEL